MGYPHKEIIKFVFLAENIFCWNFFASKISHLSVVTTFLLFFLHGLLGGGFKHFLFSPLFGEMIHFDEPNFQMGGSTTNYIVLLAFLTTKNPVPRHVAVVAGGSAGCS